MKAQIRANKLICQIYWLIFGEESEENFLGTIWEKSLMRTFIYFYSFNLYNLSFKSSSKGE